MKPPKLNRKTKLEQVPCGEKTTWSEPPYLKQRPLFSLRSSNEVGALFHELMKEGGLD